MANKRKWTAERRRKFLATVAARGKVVRRPNSPKPKLVPELPTTIDVLIDGRIRTCRVRNTTLYVATDA